MPNTYSITIFGQDQQPMANFRVQLLADGSVVSQATTDGQGVAAFPQVPDNPGALAVRADLSQTD